METNLRYDTKYNDENYLKQYLTLQNQKLTKLIVLVIIHILRVIQKASNKPAFYTALSQTDIVRKFDFARLSTDWSNYSNDNLEIVVTPYIRFNENRYVTTWEKNLPSNDNKIYTAGLQQRNTLDTSYGEVIFGFDTEYTESSQITNQDFDITANGKNYKKRYSL